MNAWRKLCELFDMGFPDDTGLTQRFSMTIKGGDFPYDDEGLADEPADPTNIHGMDHNVPTPADTRHTAWADHHDGPGQQYLDQDANADAEQYGEAWTRLMEVEGSPMLIGKDSGTTGKNSADPNYGNGEADRHVDDDELETDGKDVKGEDVNDMKNGDMGDHELKNFMKDMQNFSNANGIGKGGQVNYPGSEAPSDIFTFGGGGDFMQGLGHMAKGRGDLHGIRDGIEGELPARCSWSYLEAMVVREMSQKK
jgi:hypothetical protein